MHIHGGVMQYVQPIKTLLHHNKYTQMAKTLTHGFIFITLGRNCQRNVLILAGCKC